MDNQPELTPQGSTPSIKGLFIPSYLLPIYALLLIAFGWFAGEGWRNNPPVVIKQAVAQSQPAVVKPDSAQVTLPTQKVTTQPQPPALANDELPALRYSAHVYASEEKERSITLNGQRYHEGDSPTPNLTIEQIQQDVTIFNFNGEVFTLDALEDWPGGKVDEENAGEK